MLKKVVTIQGTLMVPLQVGQKAVIRHSGDFIRTSRVVDVILQNTEYACFETMNSVYKVYLETAPATVPSVPYLRMVA